MGKLDGRVALITGGARGQGEAEARLFVELGAKVAVSDVLEKEGRAVAADLGDDAVFLPLDVTSETAWEKAVGSVVERFGRLDVLVNDTGIVVFAPPLQTSLDDYRRVVEIIQVGVFLGMRTVAPAMAPDGSIINISSIDGLVGTPGLVAYVASKFAVRGMTKVAAMELAGHWSDRPPAVEGSREPVGGSLRGGRPGRLPWPPTRAATAPGRNSSSTAG